LVKLRLKRAGKKKKPVYKIVAADARSPRDGRFIEEVGYYDPNFDPIKLSVKYSRVNYWIKNGAKPTTTVFNLLKNEGIMFQIYLEKKGKTADEITYEMEKFKNSKINKIAKAKEKKDKLKLKKKQAAKTSQAESETPKTEENSQ